MGRKQVVLNGVYSPSEDAVARDIQGEIVIIPLFSNARDGKDAIYTTNKTGKVIWERLDGKKNLRQVALELGKTFDADVKRIEKDVLGFVQELFKRKMVVEVK